ncbi:hypothetical protein GCM10023166_26850 [Paeniglutamicibacter cryotolerans]
MGLARKVPPNTAIITYENCQYSVPAHLLDAQVFVRFHRSGTDTKVIIMHVGSYGPREMALGMIFRAPPRWTRHSGWPWYTNGLPPGIWPH